MFDTGLVILCRSIICLDVSSSAVNCLERLVSKVTCVMEWVLNIRLYNYTHCSLFHTVGIISLKNTQCNLRGTGAYELHDQGY